MAGTVGRVLRAGMAALVLALAGLPARAAVPQDGASAWFVTDQGRVRLVAATDTIAGGTREVGLGLQFELAPHWKIYWRSPGDAGYPPRLDWQGSRNLAAAALAWPAPRRFAVLGLQTVGYTGRVVLPITARLQHPGEPLALHLQLDYLTCAEICVPYRTTLALDLPAGAGGGGYAALIARAEAAVPGDGRTVGLALAGAAWRPGNAPMLDLDIRSDRPLHAPDAFIEGGDGVSFGPPQVVPGPAPDETVLRLPASGETDALGTIPGRRLTVTLVDGTRAMEGTVTPVLGPPRVDLAMLLPMLALALLGGLILNVMPCVLPVLALKLLGAIAHGRSAGAVRLGFVATAGGILASFLALALVAIGLMAGGQAADWGVQFQNPVFLTAMAAVLTLFGCNLWGLFEIPLPRAAADFGARFGGRTALGSFFTGAFATLLATPCSAPFLGTAVGFALATGPGEILAIFLALGVGFAAPYLLVAAVPRLALLLPRPGRWMVTVRRLLGLALGASALWLLWVLSAESGPVAALAVAGLMLLAAALTAWRHRPGPRAVAIAGVLAVALAVPIAVPPPPTIAMRAGYWRPFDPAAIAGLVRNGQVVFVDVTADWCLTCKVNERLVLQNPAVRDQLTAPGVIAMRADWTRPSPAIAGYLRRFGRYGIPFNAVYGPAAPAGRPLPEILTAARVTAALHAAAGPHDIRAQR